MAGEQYDPAQVEASWYSWWETSGFFRPPARSDVPKFVMVLPPPNVTGHLHVGHALTVSIQDALIRHARMCGKAALWIPGVDHAGIATQVVVEKMLAATEKVSRHELGREQFLERVWEWKMEHGGVICEQLRRMGSSLDWTRECFTMDEPRSAAVAEAFLRLHQAGLIYRANRIVNWDIHLKTAISDIEVTSKPVKDELVFVPGYDKKQRFGVMYHIAYPVEGGGEIVVATTRPETIFGDTAVAVNSVDRNYTALHGKFVVHPFNKKRLPIICDSAVKVASEDGMEGTGAMKVTPAHDAKDFTIGVNHKLEFINILTDDGRINEHGGEAFRGLKRFHARDLVVQALEDKGLLRGVFPHETQLNICSRSQDVLEPMLKPQWYVDCKQMAARACDAVRTQELDILPSHFKDHWFRWLENIQDWCVSRQLWWGHRIPAWYATLELETEETFGLYEDHWAVAESEAAAEAVLMQRFPGVSFKVQQDPDVLDTWFSSALFPFSTLGWPERTSDYRDFYPTTLLETGHDILFFWVARMVMLGLQLTGRLPFRRVLLHGMVRDAHKRKMSKSLGNVIDPLDVISGITLENLIKKLHNLNVDPSELDKARQGLEADFPRGIPECGVDALRFGLIAYTAQAENINLDIQRILGYRHWCNKLWNAVRFVKLHLPPDFEPAQDVDTTPLPLCCKWILSTLSGQVGSVNAAFERLDLSAAATAVYSWWQYELCDVFIELVKSLLGSTDGGRAAAQQTLWICVETGLRLLHPFMPFVSEELWQKLPGKRAAPGSIMVASYPQKRESWLNMDVELKMNLVDSIVKAARSLRAAAALKPRDRPECYLVTRDVELSAMLSTLLPELQTLASLSGVKVVPTPSQVPTACGVGVINERLTAYLVFHGLSLVRREIAKLLEQREAHERRLEDVRRRMLAARGPGKAALEERARKFEAEAQLGQENLCRLLEILPYELPKDIFFCQIVARCNREDVGKWKAVSRQWRTVLDGYLFLQAWAGNNDRPWLTAAQALLKTAEGYEVWYPGARLRRVFYWKNGYELVGYSQGLFCFTTRDMSLPVRFKESGENIDGNTGLYGENTASWHLVVGNDTLGWKELPALTLTVSDARVFSKFAVGKEAYQLVLMGEKVIRREGLTGNWVAVYSSVSEQWEMVDELSSLPRMESTLLTEAPLLAHDIDTDCFRVTGYCSNVQRSLSVTLPLIGWKNTFLFWYKGSYYCAGVDLSSGDVAIVILRLQNGEWCHFSALLAQDGMFQSADFKFDEPFLFVIFKGCRGMKRPPVSFNIVTSSWDVEHGGAEGAYGD